MNQFVGRKEELKSLHMLRDFKRVCLVTIQVRRRIGKSRLVQEFAKGKRFLSFGGITPTVILFNMGEVAQSVLDAQYFYKIVNIADLFVGVD